MPHELLPDTQPAALHMQHLWKVSYYSRYYKKVARHSFVASESGGMLNCFTSIAARKINRYGTWQCATPTRHTCDLFATQMMRSPPSPSYGPFFLSALLYFLEAHHNFNKYRVSALRVWEVDLRVSPHFLHDCETGDLKRLVCRWQNHSPPSSWPPGSTTETQSRALLLQWR